MCRVFPGFGLSSCFVCPPLRGAPSKGLGQTKSTHPCLSPCQEVVGFEDAAARFLIDTSRHRHQRREGMKQSQLQHHRPVFHLSRLPPLRSKDADPLHQQLHSHVGVKEQPGPNMVPGYVDMWICGYADMRVTCVVVVVVSLGNFRFHPRSPFDNLHVWVVVVVVVSLGNFCFHPRSPFDNLHVLLLLLLLS